MDLYLGAWELVPELSRYEQGTPPTQGTYVLDRVGAVLQVPIRWRTAAAAEEMSSFFAAPENGRVQPLAGGGAADAMSCTRVDERTLDSHGWAAVADRPAPQGRSGSGVIGQEVLGGVVVDDPLVPHLFDEGARSLPTVRGNECRHVERHGDSGSI